ncbi:alpha/beta hydrolase [Mariniflexile sp. HNIBRBA6329]|uniref:alpha/beta hydrolase n=1 Tax=Mariniflexile sp. HNIBRBA6329 TaxID=3373088 RepID=UPI0037460892
MAIKNIFLMLSFFFVAVHGFAQNEIIPLWSGDIPNSQKSDDKEIVKKSDATRISLVQIPTLEVFLPTPINANGKAVIICPGGGYQHLSYDWEGTDIAKWCNSKGITAFVLKYRLPNSKSVKVSYDAPLQDAQRAIRIVRLQSEKWHINPNKIGIMGFSAGGHLASTLGTQFNKVNRFKETAVDTISARPDFMVLIYPVITMISDYTHNGSQFNLLGNHPTEALINEYSNELQVTENTPPTFIVHSTNDTVVPVENSLNLYIALKDKRIKAEMHIYPEGGHGFGLGLGQGYLQTWTDRLYDWLQLF